MSRFKLGICQMKVGPDKNKNLEKAGEMIAKAVNDGCQVVVLPEMFTCPYDAARFSLYAEEVSDGPTSIILSQWAQKHGIYVVGGSFPEREKDKIYNTSCVFGPDGRLVARHRKMHLFDVAIEDGISFQESSVLSKGEEITVFTTPFCPMGLAICYDLRFPELARAMVLRGAKILLYPAAFNTTTGPAHWEMLLRARAVDNQVYVAGASQAPSGYEGYPAYGHSMIIDPWGSIICQLSYEESILTGIIDLEKLERIRRELPVLAHLRPENY